MAAPARCASLILSDVVGNPLEAIGSGLTVFCADTPADVLAILDRYDVVDRLDDGRLPTHSHSPHQHFTRDRYGCSRK